MYCFVSFDGLFDLWNTILLLLYYFIMFDSLMISKMCSILLGSIVCTFPILL